MVAPVVVVLPPGFNKPPREKLLVVRLGVVEVVVPGFVKPNPPKPKPLPVVVVLEAIVEEGVIVVPRAGPLEVV